MPDKTASAQKDTSSANMAKKTACNASWPTTLLLVSIIVAIFGAASLAQPTAERPKDLVKFFKDAISNPPHVEHFVAGLRPLGELPKVRGRTVSGEFSFLAGARAGTNYFMRSLTASNSLATHPSGNAFGRVGTTNYTFTDNSVSYTMGTNLMSTIGSGNYRLSRQFLNMGLGIIEPTTVVWQDNEFRAADFLGAPKHGVLKISNGLPHLLTISERPGARPLKCIEYFYPTPPNALQGFPTRMVVSNMTETGWVPAVENAILEVKLAPVPLATSFFYETQFKGPHILHTNIFSNSVVLATEKQGRLIDRTDFKRRP